MYFLRRHLEWLLGRADRLEVLRRWQSEVEPQKLASAANDQHRSSTNSPARSRQEQQPVARE